MGMIVLLTDFGYRDPYVGVMKGVIKSINPLVEVVDLTHGINKHDVYEAALVLMVSAKYFPRNTIFVCVVDPGVGSERRALLIKTRNYYLIGPDNGCLYPLANRDGIVEVYDISHSRYRLSRTSYTFHGRDLFAPVAAYLSLGYGLEDLGVKIDFNDIVKLDFGKPIFSRGSVRAKVLYIDVFGNIMTNVEEEQISDLGLKIGDKLKVVIHGRGEAICRYVRSFSHVVEGDYACYINSWGFLEIAINKGNAAQALRASRGDDISIEKHL